jgi:hypothetical protein
MYGYNNKYVFAHASLLLQHQTLPQGFPHYFPRPGPAKAKLVQSVPQYWKPRSNSLQKRARNDEIGWYLVQRISAKWGVFFWSTNGKEPGVFYWLGHWFRNDWWTDFLEMELNVWWRQAIHSDWHTNLGRLGIIWGGIIGATPITSRQKTAKYRRFSW